MKTARMILSQLIDQYENSLVSKGGTQRAMKQRVRISKKNFPKYFANDGYHFKTQLNDELFVMKKRGWVEVEYDDDYEIISQVTLLYDHLDDIYRELKRQSRQNQEQMYLKLIEKHLHNDILKPYLIDLKERIEQYQAYKSLVYPDLKKTESLFTALYAVLNQKEEIAERVFSSRVLSDSKLFAELKPKITSILRQYYYADPEMNSDELMAEYNILRNPMHIHLKGKATLRVGRTIIYLEDFQDGFALSSADLSKLEILELPVQRIVTIENLTSFYTAELTNTLCIYLGGFHNTLRRKLLMLLARYTSVPFYHFGDIDAGGIRIFYHLCEKTQIAFQSVCMDVHTLNQFASQCVELTQEDHRRLTDLLNQPMFQDTIEWMLMHNKKLEQEHITITDEDFQ